MGIHIKDDVEVARTYKKQEEMRTARENEIVDRSLAMVSAYVAKVDMHGQNKKLVRLLYDRYGTELIRKMQDLHFELFLQANKVFEHDTENE